MGGCTVQQIDRTQHVSAALPQERLSGPVSTVQPVVVEAPQGREHAVDQGAPPVVAEVTPIPEPPQVVPAAQLPPQDEAIVQAMRRYQDTNKWTDIEKATSVTYAYEPTRQYKLTCPEWGLLTVRLLPGEELRDVAGGNPVEWMVKATTSGNPPAPLLMIRRAPYAPTAEFAFITDQNVYRFLLIPGAGGSTRTIAFYDPEAEWKAYREHEAALQLEADRRRLASENRTPKLAAERVREYAIEGGHGLAWRPLWVRGDDQRTFVQLPANAGTEQPTLTVQHDGQAMPVNYRTVPGQHGNGPLMVADQAFSQAVLTGQGGTITITRGTK